MKCVECEVREGTIPTWNGDLVCSLCEKTLEYEVKDDLDMIYEDDEDDDTDYWDDED